MTTESDAAVSPLADPAATDKPPVAVSGAEVRRAGRAGARVMVAGLVVLVAVAVLGGAEWRRADRLAGRDRVRRDVAHTAGSFGQALLSYDYADLGAARTRVLSLATDNFAQNYTSAFTNGLSAAITSVQARASGTVRKVYVADVNGDTADAVVTLDSEVHSSQGTRQVVGSYLAMTLQRIGGHWKVDTVTSIASSSDNLTPAPGASAATTAPSTTAPSATGK
jgi:Mce-associated membrane protein